MKSMQHGRFNGAMFPLGKAKRKVAEAAGDRMWRKGIGQHSRFLAVAEKAK